MKNKNIYTIIGIVVVVLAVIIIAKSDKAGTTPESAEPKAEVSDQKAGAVKIPVTKSVVAKGSQQSVVGSPAVSTSSNLPDIDFIDKRISLDLKDFPGVKLTIEKVAFGRGETVTSTGCSGIPNANFSAYLYPGSGICLNESTVDSSARGIVAFHILVENNNGQIGFGGNSEAVRLHYLRSDSTGKPVHRFALPLIDFGSYYITPYSSKVVVLSYLVPEDQLVYDLLVGYKAPLLENQTLNVYSSSSNGFLADFSSKTLKIVK